MKTKQSILIILICALLISLGGLSCSSVKTAVACPEIAVKKSKFKSHRKTGSPKTFYTQKTRVKSNNANRVKTNQTKVIKPVEPVSVADRNINISKAEFTKGFIASVDNTVYPAIQSGPSFFNSSESNRYDDVQYSQSVQNVKCDTIYLKSGIKIIGKVEEIGQTEIKYRRCDNLTGPLISLLKSEISGIHYPNGTIETFTQRDTNTQNPVFTSNNDSAPAKTEGLGLAGFISGLAGLFVASIPLGTIAIIFGGVSLSKINRNPQRYKGKGFAIASIVLGLVDVVVMIVLLAAML